VKTYVVDDQAWSHEESANKFLNMKFIEWKEKNRQLPNPPIVE
jgi:hypothetical protein